MEISISNIFFEEEHDIMAKIGEELSSLNRRKMNPVKLCPLQKAKIFLRKHYVRNYRGYLNKNKKKRKLKFLISFY